MNRRAALLLLMLAAPARASVDTPLHDYVLGRHAFASDQLGRASGYFAGALAGDPGDPTLARRAFDLAVASGDEKLAVALLPKIARDDRFDAPVTLLRAVEALKAKDWSAVDAERARLTEAGFAAFAAPVIEAWTLYARGDGTAALARLDPASQEGFARAYVVEHRAHLLAAMKRWDEAAATYATLLTSGGGNIVRLRLAEAAALQAGGRAAEARKLLADGGRDPAYAAAMVRLAAGQPIRAGIVSPRDGVAILFTRMAADLSREKPLPIALVLARYATFLAPGDADTWIMTADLLARGGQVDPPLAALDHVRADDPLWPAARARRADILAQGDRQGDALALLEAAARTTGGFDDWARLGEGYSRAQRYPEAAAAFDKAIALDASPGPEKWYLLFSRGAARERAGDWRAAEADLRAALAVAPTEATVLNYLGYAMLDRGERLPEAQMLIERAVAAKPEDGFIADSLGWAYFRTGKYADAVTQLERAAAVEGDDATINEHLGDAYWKAGRRIEARFRWKASLDAGPEPDAAARVAKKIDYGLDVATAMTRP